MTQAEYVPFRGGLDEATPALETKMGRVTAASNHEPDLNGGYARIGGYERLDGRAAPSAAVYYTMELADASGVSVDDTLTGGTSSATAVVVYKSDNVLAVTALSGTFVVSETAGGSTVAVVPVANGLIDDVDDEVLQGAAADYYRGLIQAVPGDGAIRGVWRHDAVIYAFRNDGAACKLYKATGSGWTLIAYNHVLLFDGGTAAINEGDSITGATSGATATVERSITYSGATGTSDAAGYLVLSGVSGTFSDNENIQVGGATKSIANGASYQHNQLADGFYQFESKNFYASSSTYRIYGCDGVNPGFEFDGTVFAPILHPNITGVPSANTPHLVCTHKNHLFFAFPNGSVQHSVQGEPLTWSGFLGAAEFGLSHDVTDLKSQAGKVLLMFTDEDTHGLYGNNVSDWVKDGVSPETGAKAFGAAVMGDTYALDDKDIVKMSRVQAYGNFQTSAVSRLINKTLAANKHNLVDTVQVKDKNQIRFVFSGGYFIIMYFPESGPPEFMPCTYADNIACISSCKDENKAEHIYFGDDNGFVYEADIGPDFDGAEIEAVARLPFNHFKNPDERKRFRRCKPSIKTASKTTVMVTPEFSYGDEDTPIGLTKTMTMFRPGGIYDETNWDEVIYDGKAVAQPTVDTPGRGTNIGLIFYSKSRYISPYTLQGNRFFFERGRLQR